MQFSACNSYYSYLLLYTVYGTAQMQHRTRLRSQNANALTIANQSGVALVSPASIHPTRNEINTHEWNGCHAPLISDYSSTHNRLTRECATLHLSGTVWQYSPFRPRSRPRRWSFPYVTLYFKHMCSRHERKLEKEEGWSLQTRMDSIHALIDMLKKYNYTDLLAYVQ